MLVNLSDEQLVELSVNKNSEAFGEIVKRWERKIFALCYGMLNREEDARDAVQETFIAAFRNIASFRGDSKVSSWLHRIAVNQCLTKHRRKKSRAENYLEDEIETNQRAFAAPLSESPLYNFEQNSKLLLVRKAVNSLPEDLRQVVVMKEFEELTFQQISEAIDLPLSTVKSRLYTALKQLRMRLEKVEIEVV
jgi:RNA polymerase sigma-70 factor, ECF subfamily